MADGLRRMKVAEKMAAFEREVRGDEHLMATRRAEDGAVVTNAEHKACSIAGPVACRRLRSPDLFNQCEFAEWPGHASRINAARAL